VLDWLERIGKENDCSDFDRGGYIAPSRSAALQTRLRLGDCVSCVFHKRPLRNGKQGPK